MHSPGQFTVRGLLIGVSAIAVCLAIAVRWPAALVLVGIGVAICGFAYMVTRSPSHRRSAFAALSLIVVLGFAALLFVPEVQEARSGRRISCLNNLHGIGIALQSYHKARGHYPPPYVADANGRPLYSWRVLILPYMDQRSLFSTFHHDEPWDGPNNSKLHKHVIEEFHCPEDIDSPATDTSYVAVVGNGTAWPDGAPAALKDMTDGAENTILLVEVRKSGIHWMEPRDLHIVQRAPGVNPAKGQGISSSHKHTANVCFADGRVTPLPDGISDTELQSLLLIADGKPRRK